MRRSRCSGINMKGLRIVGKGKIDDHAFGHSHAWADETIAGFEIFEIHLGHGCGCLSIALSRVTGAKGAAVLVPRFLLLKPFALIQVGPSIAAKLRLPSSTLRSSIC